MMGEEPSAQYGIPFNDFNWGPNTEKISSNTDRSIKYRRHIYTILSSIDTKEFKEFTNILKLTIILDMYNLFNDLGRSLDIATNYFYAPKKKL